MANPEHLEILKQGLKAWNMWRQHKPEIDPNLTKAKLIGKTLCGADLSYVDLRSADLRGANLSGADLRGADFTYVPSWKFGAAENLRVYVKADGRISERCWNGDGWYTGGFSVPAQEVAVASWFTGHTAAAGTTGQIHLRVYTREANNSFNSL